MNTGYTKKLACYAANLCFEDLPEEVVLQAKRIAMHAAGVALAASTTAIGRKALAYGRSLAASAREASVIGCGEKLSVGAAALVNGALTDCLDWEDCSWTGHPSACAVPTACAVAEHLGASGKDFLLALVTAYEVYERIAMSVQPGDNFGWLSKGWGLTSWSIYASAIAAGKLLRLDAGRMENLIGIAGALTPAINATTHLSRSDFYHYQWGLNNYSGIAGAMLARNGISPMPDYLDGNTGYWVTMTDECKWGWLDRGLGGRFLIMETLFKHWPTNMWIQQALDGTAELVRKYRVLPGDVVEVVVNPVVETRMIAMPEGYPSMVDAQFSIPYCVSVLIHDPDAGPQWYEESRRRDRSVVELSLRVRAEGPTLYLKEAFERFQRGEYPEYSVSILLKDGRRLFQAVPLPKGHPRNMFSQAEFEADFMRRAVPALSESGARSASDMIMNVDAASDIRELMRTLSGAGR